MATPSFVRAGSLRRLLIFLLLPVLVQLHATAWYGTRSIQHVFLYDAGWDHSSIGVVFAVTSALGILGMLLAGIVGAVVGARLTLLLGLLLAGVGFLGMALPPPAVFVAFLGVGALGHGLITPSVSATVVDAFPRPREALRGAALALVYAAVNGGAMAGSMGAPAMSNLWGAVVVFAVCGLVALLAVPFCVPLFVAPAGPPENDPTTRIHVPGLIASVGLLFLLVVPIALRNHAFQQHFVTATLHAGGVSSGFWMSINPGTIVAATVPLVLLLALLGFAKLRLPDLLPAGIGLLLSALTTAMLAVPPSVLPAPLAVTAMVLGAVGELLAGVFVVSRIGGDLHWRLSTPLLAAWFAGTYTLAAACQLVAPPDYGGNGVPIWFMVVTAVVLALAGLVTVLAAIPLHRFVYPDPTMPAPTEA